MSLSDTAVVYYNVGYTLKMTVNKWSEYEGSSSFESGGLAVRIW
jgi:hypothetical protein